MVEQPAKVMRIGTMIKQLLEEVRAAPLDEAGRQRLREIHESSIKELEQGLSPELREELDRLTLPFGSGVPSEAELRIAQAELVGWLAGVFHGIQTALFASRWPPAPSWRRCAGPCRPGLEAAAARLSLFRADRCWRARPVRGLSRVRRAAKRVSTGPASTYRSQVPGVSVLRPY
jgi:hypothetical protein